MAFLDEEQQEAPAEPIERPRRPDDGPRRRRQQYMVRRMIGAGVMVGFVILVVLAFRGCLEARKERSIRNYSQDVSTIMSESEQRGKEFFDLLDDPGGVTDKQFEDQIRQIRGSSESLLSRAEDLDVPDEMSEAQEAVTLSLRLRRDALGKIADNSGAALADEETAEAVQTITNQMSALYSSDVLWTQLALPKIQEVLDAEGISGSTVEGGNFMPDPEPASPLNLEWLDESRIREFLSQVTGADVSSGTHGLGIVQVALGGTALSPDSTSTVSASDREIAVEVQNQGTVEESDVSVVISVNGEELPRVSVASIGPGETATAKASLTNVPTDGSEVSIEVLAEPVEGETVTDNNEFTYSVIFG